MQENTGPDRISDVEFAVMEVLWEKARMAAKDIADKLTDSRGWSLTTVKTLLSRLAAKAVVTHAQDGRHFLYSPIVEREDYVTGESRRLVDRLFGGKFMPLLTHLAEKEKLSDDEISEIERLLREMKS